MTGLLVAEEVPGATDLEIAHRDVEPGAELRVVGERAEACACLLRQLRRGRIEKVGVGGDVRAAHATADLVQLRKAQHVGALDDERVRLRDVDARFDDRGRDEHVRVARDERVHALLELALAIWPWATRKRSPGQSCWSLTCASSIVSTRLCR